MIVNSRENIIKKLESNDPAELAAVGSVLILIAYAKIGDTMPDSIDLLRRLKANWSQFHEDIMRAQWDQLRNWS